MAENQDTSAAVPPPPDPYVGGSPAEAQAKPDAPKSPWAAAQPLVPVKDPAVRLEPPPDPYAGRLGPASQGQIAGGGGSNEMIMAGIGRILEGQAQILEMLRGGARF